MFYTALKAIVTQEFRILRRDPAPFTVLFAMPALAMLLFTPALGAVLREQGNLTASGAELALPGMTVMFGSLGAAFLGFAIFREHQWQSWERLLASPAPITSLILGKTVVPFFLVFGQQLALLLLVALVYDTPLPNAWYAYVMVAAGFAFNVIALGLVAATLCRSLQQMNAIIHIGALLLAASCGAFIPTTQLPEWGQWLSTITPSYWMVQSQTATLLNQVRFDQVVLSFSVLFVQGLILCAIAASRFQANERKYNWA